ncbi:hypothetical protein P4I85_00200 [Bacillus cereus]|nr:hypothetical protein [Bacillus cereus]MEB9558978.1 hypothetical protein [Bacillus cereus]
MLILTAFVNWIIIYMLLALYIDSNILAAFISAVIIGVPPAFRKKTTLRIFSIKRAVILRIKRLFYT